MRGIVANTTSSLLLLLLLLCVLVQQCSGVVHQKPSNLVGKRHDVYIAGFFPYDRNVPESAIGRGVMPAVKLAVDHINENPSVLRNYLLHMWWNDTQCNAAVGMKALFDMIHEGPHKLMLFGAACTQVTDPIAKASKHWKLTQLSYADTHPMFGTDNFPNFFRMVPSENAFNLPRLKLLQEFNWTRVGTVYQNEPRYSLAHNRLIADLDGGGCVIEESQSFSNEVVSALSKLREKDVRIILGNFNESWAREIFCEAFRSGLYGRKYQWLIMGTYSHEWWTKNLPQNCSLEDLKAALEGAILTDLLPLSTNGEITISGNTAEDYRVEYDARRGKEYSRFHGYTYDGVWTVALAIQHVAHRIRQIRKNETMQDFRYRDALWEKLFLEALAETSFEGVTGPVRFYDNERRASVMLKQFQDGQEVKIGEFNGVTKSLDLSRGHQIRWLGKYPPKDRTLEILENSRVNLTVYTVLAATACLGIILTIVFLYFNIVYRNQRYIKMSSPYVNNLIIIGCLLTYTSVIFLGLDSQLTSIEAFPYICTARAWLLMSGFSLAFGSMFSKTWRVHSIFTDVKLNKKVIKDYQLFMVVGVLVGIDLAIMSTWQIADPFYRETKKMDSYSDPSNDDILITPVNEYCQSEHMTVFVGSIYAYKGLLMVFGAFLAWETRHVSIPALNDSKYVGMSVYNVVIMCVMGAAISFVLSDKQDASFVIISVFIIFCTTATLFLVFVPKLVELRRNPQGVIDKKTRATLRPISKSRRDSEASELEDKIKDAKQANAKYRKQVLDMDSELQVLVRCLGAEAGSIVAMETATADRLSVPLLKKEPPSGTETTEVSSLCSLNSSQDDEPHLSQQTPGPRKKTSFAKKTIFEDDLRAQEISILRKDQQKPVKSARFFDEPRNVSFGPPPKLSSVAKPIEQERSLELLGITQIHPKLSEAEHLPPTYQNLPLPGKPPDFEERIQEVTSHLTTQLLRRHDEQYSNCDSLRRRSSVKSASMVVAPQLEHRRTSVPTWSYVERKNARNVRRPVCRMHDNGQSEVKYIDKSEYWVCPPHHRAPSPAPKESLDSSNPSINCDSAQYSDSSIHRSGSERNSRIPYAARSTESFETSTTPPPLRSRVLPSSRQLSKQATVDYSDVPSNLTHVLSTPDVATSTRPFYEHTNHHNAYNIYGTEKRKPRKPPCSQKLYGAVSEGELLDISILPIFQKLLTERHKARSGYGASIASCPNISIKCDIVEYL